MKRLTIGLLLLLSAAPQLGAADRDFQAVVRGVESSLGIRRLHIPLFGFATFLVRAAHPYGVGRFDMAIFESPGLAPRQDGWFESIMHDAVGGRWTNMIRVRDHNELTYIYARPEGHRWKMIIATFDAQDAVILQATVKPETLLEALDEPRTARHTLAGDKE